MIKSEMASKHAQHQQILLPSAYLLMQKITLLTANNLLTGDWEIEPLLGGIATMHELYIDLAV